MATYYYEAEFLMTGSLTSEQYRLVYNLLKTLTDEFDLELLESELE